MGASFVPITIFTVLWGVVGIVCPIFAPKGPNRGIIQVVLMLTAATCWLFWLCAYMAQMNPLIGPRLNNETLIWIAHTWSTFRPPSIACTIPVTTNPSTTAPNDNTTRVSPLHEASSSDLDRRRSATAESKSTARALGALQTRASPTTTVQNKRWTASDVDLSTT